MKQNQPETRSDRPPITQSVVALVDVSPWSPPPGGYPVSAIDEANSGVIGLYRDLGSTRGRTAEVCLMTFAESIRVLEDFRDANAGPPPPLTTAGTGKDLGGAVVAACDRLQTHRNGRLGEGHDVAQCVLVLFLHGAPDRNSQLDFDRRLRGMIESGALYLLPIMLGGNEAFDTLNALSPRVPPMRLTRPDESSAGWKEVIPLDTPLD